MRNQFSEESAENPVEMIVETDEKRRNRGVPARFAPSPVRTRNSKSISDLQNCAQIEHRALRDSVLVPIFFHTGNRFHRLNLAVFALPPLPRKGAFRTLFTPRGGIRP